MQQIIGLFLIIVGSISLIWGLRGIKQKKIQGYGVSPFDLIKLKGKDATQIGILGCIIGVILQFVGIQHFIGT